jgi:hypothetical protein
MFGNDYAALQCKHATLGLPTWRFVSSRSSEGFATEAPLPRGPFAGRAPAGPTNISKQI